MFTTTFSVTATPNLGDTIVENTAVNPHRSSRTGNAAKKGTTT
jgi:hypothetical protein